MFSKIKNGGYDGDADRYDDDEDMGQEAKDDDDENDGDGINQGRPVCLSSLSYL